MPLIINFSQIISETRAFGFHISLDSRCLDNTLLITSRQGANVLSYALQSSASSWASCT